MLNRSRRVSRGRRVATRERTLWTNVQRGKIDRSRVRASWINLCSKLKCLSLSLSRSRFLLSRPSRGSLTRRRGSLRDSARLLANNNSRRWMIYRLHRWHRELSGIYDDHAAASAKDRAVPTSELINRPRLNSRNPEGKSPISFELATARVLANANTNDPRAS